MSIQSDQSSMLRVVLSKLIKINRLPIDKLSGSVQHILILNTALKHDNHHLIIDFIQLYHFQFASHVVNKYHLVQFEKFDMFYEQAYHLVLVHHSVERGYPQKLVEFLLGSRQLYFQLTDERLVRHCCCASHRSCVPTSFGLF